MPKSALAPELYLNRELGQLEFNRRVLALAEDKRVPALERLRYLCIVSSNLDEFFEVRVAGLKQQIEQGIAVSGPDGLSPQRVLQQVTVEAHELIREQYELLNKVILPRLADEGIRFHRRDSWTDAQRT